MKPTLPAKRIEHHLRDRFPTLPPTSFLQPLAEGEESQAFAFDVDAQKFVVRINHSRDGFDKDAYAHRHFHAPNLPVPRVHQIGPIYPKNDSEHFACVSERLPGVTLQDADDATLAQSLAPTLAAWQAIGAMNISHTSGFGPFDLSGNAPFSSWGDFLRAEIDWSEKEWRELGAALGRVDVATLRTNLLAQIDALPVVRTLVHGDFGSNNVLTNGNVISGVLDWEEARYGDPLFDLAGAYFWRTWLHCMARLANHCDAHLAHMLRYRQRIGCYQLWVGLVELHESLSAGDAEWSAWLAHRVRETL